MKRLSPGVRFLLGFISFILCILLFVSTLAGILVANVVQILSSQDNLETLLRQVLFVETHRAGPVHIAPGGNAPALHQAPAKSLAPSDIRLDAPVAVPEVNTSASVVEWIYGELVDDFGEGIQISLEEVQDFVERSTLDDFIVETAATLLNDVYTGENTVVLSGEKIQALIEENAALIEEVFQVPVDMEVVNSVTSVIEENEYVDRIQEEGITNIILNPNGSQSEDTPEADDTTGVVPQDKETNSMDVEMILDTARTVLSINTIFIFGGICLLLIALVLVTNIKQIWAGMNAVGITLMLAALPFVFTTVLVWTVPAGWAEQFGLIRMVEALVREIVNINATICIGVFALGLVLLVSGIVISCIVRKKRKQAAETEKLSEDVFAAAPTTVEFPAVEEAPVVEELPVPEELPALEETPVEETPATEETPVEETPATEETTETV